MVFNLFYENSTRTLMSFATAAHRLGALGVTLPVEQSSVKKGETLEDTARTLNAMRPDALVIRHPENGAPAAIALIMDCPVINAGDGTNEHPTQALLDAATIRQRLGRIEGLKIAICGDIEHSRVARSNAKLLPRLGAEVRLAGPPELMPDGVPPADVDEAIDGRRRGDDAARPARAARGGSRRCAGRISRALRPDRRAAGRAAPNALVMHPGPMNRGVEIDEHNRRRSRALADHASGRDGRGRADGLPGDAVGAGLARGELDRRVAGERRARSSCRRGS